MNLNIVRVGMQPHRNTVTHGNGRSYEQSIRMTSGIFETPDEVMEFDKYFVTNYDQKRRDDFVIIRSSNAPPLTETFERINRATSLGKRMIRQCLAVMGARINQDVVSCAADGGCAPDSMDMTFNLDLPLGISDLAEIPELDVKEDGEGLSWLRISTRHFDFDVDNPAMTDRFAPGLGVFISTDSPDATNVDLDHVRWQRADALLTPIDKELPGVLGDISLRSALVALRPGEIS